VGIVANHEPLDLVARCNFDDLFEEGIAPKR
jgi:hypothetical protein